MATFFSSLTRAVNFLGSSDWGPSERATSGFGWTSIIRPSAPAAMAALAIGPTYSQLPVPWLGSTMTGRWDRFLITGTALRSSVKRVWSSNVRMPRSQRMTLKLPWLRRDSAARRNSVMVAERPRLSSTGLCDWPTSLRSSKFCMLRAPICMTSAYFSTSSMSRTSISSVTTLKPVCLATSRRSLSPSSPNPWKEYGEVLGLKAPPRRICAPASFTALAVSISIWRFSTEHGPAMMMTCLPPILRPLTVTMLSSGRNSLETSLYGLRTGMTFSTPGITSSGWTRRASSEPMTPMMVRSVPLDTMGLRPSALMRTRRWSSCFLVAFGLRTMIIENLLLSFQGLCQRGDEAAILRHGADGDAQMAGELPRAHLAHDAAARQQRAGDLRRSWPDLHEDEVCHAGHIAQLQPVQFVREIPTAL